MLSMMVAYEQNHGIGKNNAMPWHLPADLSFLKKNTVGKTVVMGRSTFEAIGGPLPKRRNIVLTTQTDFGAKEGIEIAHSLDEIIAENTQSDEEWVILGGSKVYEQFFSYADRLYITYIDESFAVDRFFPSFDLNEWELTWEEKGIKNDKNPYDYWFRIYERCTSNNVKQ